MLKLAKSKSGHDKGHTYVIIREEADFVFLVDGILKKIDRPKKKNKKHIQVIQRLPENVQEILENESVTDLEIKRALKIYMKKNDKNSD